MLYCNWSTCNLSELYSVRCTWESDCTLRAPNSLLLRYTLLQRCLNIQWHKRGCMKMKLLKLSNFQ
jgi:hypothetical protein